MSEPLFLQPGEGSETPFPVRDGCTVTPLIESAEMYPALERLLLTAKGHAWFAFRVLDPMTKLRSEEALAAGHETWLDLIEATVRRGVEIRILLTDFEPVMADYLHAGSWKSFRDLQERIGETEKFQMIVIQHEGEIGWSWRQILRLALRRKLRKLVNSLLEKRKKSHDPVFAIRPGLWRWLKWDGEEPAGWKSGSPPRLWPATYHQKCTIIDGHKAVIGGLDLDERRWDDADHAQQADQTWHDISCLVEGPIVSDVEQHFMELWNHETPRFYEIIEDWTLEAGRHLPITTLTPIANHTAPLASDSGAAQTQLARTRSRQMGVIASVGPKPRVREIREAHRKLIGLACRQLYIEAQFFRSRVAADWVIDALQTNPNLEVIILIANTPEEIAFLGQSEKSVHRYGEYLQARALGRIIKRAGPDRVGLFTIVKNEAADQWEHQEYDERGIAYGSAMIHIHAKLLIADDSACLMSSANINGRSFEWDTELGFLWHQEDSAIVEFKRTLWAQLSGNTLPREARLSDWREIAEHNRTADPADRRGFIAPYQRSRARRFGSAYFWIPKNMI